MSLLLRNEPYQLTARASSTKKEPGSDFSEPGIYLATTYSHKTYRLTTIGAAAFHFRVRNGTGWFHHALVTRGQFQGKTLAASHLELGLWGPEVILNVELKSKIQNSKFIIAGREARCPLSGIHTEISFFLTCSLTAIHGLDKQDEFKNRNQANRMISTGKLNMLPRLHFQPINVVVFDDP